MNRKTANWTLVATILPSSMAFIDSTALNVILPSLQSDLGASGTDLFWVLNSYLLMLAALIIVGGGLGDKIGRVKVFKFGIIVFMIGSVLCGISPSIEFLVVFRTIQGIGGAFMIPGSLSIISAVFDNDEKGKAIGTWSASTTIVMICGPVLGGALADIGLWRLIFFINIPFGLFAIYSLSKVPESKQEDITDLDWIGALVLVFGLSALTFGFLEMPELGYSHWLVVTSLTIGLILSIGFLIIEKNTKEPMMPLQLFRNITFSGVNLLSFFLYAGIGGMMLFISLNIIQIQGYSQLQAGLTFLPFSLIMILMARRMGKMTDKYGARRFLIVGPSIAGFGMLWLSNIGITNGPTEYWTTYFPPFVLFALGMSITVVPLTTEVMSCVDKSKSGIASGINNSVTRISGTFMNAIAGALAIFLFSGFIENQVFLMDLDDVTIKSVLSETIKLGNAQVPQNVTGVAAAGIGQMYKDAFIDTYSWIGKLSASLAFLSSVFAFFMVKNYPK